MADYNKVALLNERGEANVLCRKRGVNSKLVVSIVEFSSGVKNECD